MRVCQLWQQAYLWLIEIVLHVFECKILAIRPKNRFSWRLLTGRSGLVKNINSCEQALYENQPYRREPIERFAVPESPTKAIFWPNC